MHITIVGTRFVSVSFLQFNVRKEDKHRPYPGYLDQYIIIQIIFSLNLFPLNHYSIDMGT